MLGTGAGRGRTKVSRDTRSLNPGEAYHDQTHCRAVSTHCSFTREPPQKCWPCLREQRLGEAAVSPGTRARTAILGRDCACRARYPSLLVQSQTVWPRLLPGDKRLGLTGCAS